LLRPLGADDRERVLRELRHQVGDEATGRADYRALTWSEIAQLTRGGLVEVGAHTVSHPVLAEMPVDVQRQEIADSKRDLETYLQRSITAFAYPYGGAGDFDARTLQLVRAAGMRTACTTRYGPATRLSRLLALPRLTVRDWPADRLAERLEAVFRA
jgi:peptidoglycan/xylan/chitin deacetylase (PgdA/CDA1 family)